ncbi:MAG: hypothetical protein ACLP9L_31035, partial [Thermoguttaceae bacterium]
AAAAENAKYAGTPVVVVNPALRLATMGTWCPAQRGREAVSARPVAVNSVLRWEAWVHCARRSEGGK